MSRSSLPASDGQFDAWLRNFAAQLSASSPALGLTSDEVAALSDATGRWTASLTAHLAAREAAWAASAAKRDARETAERLVRPLVRRVQAHPSTTDALRAAMGITVSQAPTRAPLDVPADVPLLRLDFGMRGRIDVHAGPNPASGNRNGLPRRAIGVLIQVRNADAPGAGSPWHYLATSTSSPYRHVLDASPTSAALGAATSLAYRAAYVYRRGQQGPWSGTAEASVTR